MPVGVMSGGRIFCFPGTMPIKHSEGFFVRIVINCSANLFVGANAANQHVTKSNVAALRITSLFQCEFSWATIQFRYLSEEVDHVMHKH